MANDSDVLATVGPRLRVLRERRETTLAELSAETGISVSTLSRLESGQRKPTLELLLPLARAYRVQLDELVDAPPTGDPRVHLRPVQRNGMTLIPLSRYAGGVQAFKMIIPGGRRCPEQKTHEGYEWMYVLSGRLRLLLGDQNLVLKAGEAVEFDTRGTTLLRRRGRGSRRGAEPVRPPGRAGTSARHGHSRRPVTDPGRLSIVDGRPNGGGVSGRGRTACWWGSRWWGTAASGASSAWRSGIATLCCGTSHGASAPSG